MVCPRGAVVSTARDRDSSKAYWSAPTVRDNSGAVVAVNTSHLSGDSIFPLGVTVVNVTAQDSSGNRASCSFTVEVIDTQPPTLVCPGDMLVPATNGTATGRAVWQLPDRSDNSKLFVQLQSIYEPGFASFPLGETVVR